MNIWIDFAVGALLFAVNFTLWVLLGRRLLAGGRHQGLIILFFLLKLGATGLGMYAALAVYGLSPIALVLGLTFGLVVVTAAIGTWSFQRRGQSLGVAFPDR